MERTAEIERLRARNKNRRYMRMVEGTTTSPVFHDTPRRRVELSGMQMYSLCLFFVFTFAALYFVSERLSLSVPVGVSFSFVLSVVLLWHETRGRPGVF